MWIAPSRDPEICNWTSAHWSELDLASEAGWKTAIEIFEDRIRYCYLNAIEALQKADNAYYRTSSQRRFGFSMMALDCLLIETLAQFYSGLKQSPRRQNREFYAEFLSQNSFILKNVFNKDSAECFYDNVRCGILHQAETKESTTIRFVKESNRECVLEPTEDGKGLHIYWKNFHALVKEEVNEYINHLTEKLPEILTANFKKKMNFICRVEIG